MSEREWWDRYVWWVLRRKRERLEAEMRALLPEAKSRSSESEKPS